MVGKMKKLSIFCLFLNFSLNAFVSNITVWKLHKENGDKFVIGVKDSHLSTATMGADISQDFAAKNAEKLKVQKDAFLKQAEKLNSKNSLILVEDQSIDRQYAFGKDDILYFPDISADMPLEFLSMHKELEQTSANFVPFECRFLLTRNDIDSIPSTIKVYHLGAIISIILNQVAELKIDITANKIDEYIRSVVNSNLYKALRSVDPRSNLKDVLQKLNPGEKRAFDSALDMDPLIDGFFAGVTVNALLHGDKERVVLCAGGFHVKQLGELLESIGFEKVADISAATALDILDVNAFDIISSNLTSFPAKKTKEILDNPVDAMINLAKETERATNL